MTDPELMFEFLTLGEDCEFSFIQRRATAEPLELFRFAGITMDQLIAGFKDGFATVGDPDQAHVSIIAKTEVWLMNRRPKAQWHTFQNPDGLDVPALEAKLRTKLKFLRRKFCEDLEGGRKILVFKRRTEVSLAEIMELHGLIRAAGPSTLLWVVEHDPDHAPGLVERIDEGLLKGYIDQFTPYGRAAYGSYDVWMTICRNAKKLWDAAHLTAVGDAA